VSYPTEISIYHSFFLNISQLKVSPAAIISASMAHVFLKTNIKILYNSEKMKRIFDEPPIVSYKRD
jgi:hypothetical protein